jgi:hypothetical protein
MNLTDTPRVSNVLAVFDLASPEAMRTGLSWYQTAHNWCRITSKGRPHLMRRNAGIVAALSPMNEWENNKRKAAELISLRGKVTVVKGQPNGIGLGANVAKACAIYNGADPLDVLKGDKVRAFYRTIVDPMGDIDPVIDRHAFDIAVGERTDDKRRQALSRKGVYGEFANVYREAAKVAGIGSAQMQAVTWVAWKEIHGI